MNKIFILTILVISFVSCKQKNDRHPAILDNNFPKVFFFRITEQIEDYASYEDWKKQFNQLMGIMGKALPEEIASHTKKYLRYYSTFKNDHPDQLVLLHYNGLSTDPLFETENFFDGHWLYKNGTFVTDNIPIEYTISKIKVKDASLFVRYTGKYFDRSEDVAICALDENNKPDWNYCEQAQIIDIDYENNMLTIRRRMYGSDPKTFKANKAYITAHIIEGPWGSKSSNLMWEYNYSSECPKDKNGRNCAEIHTSRIAEYFKPGGCLYNFDGIEFDALFRTMFNHSYFYLQNLGPDKKCMPDCNGDGIGDMGVFNGVNSFETGVSEFLRILRKKINEINPNIILMADAGFVYARSTGLLNGIETEGYGKLGNDNQFNWSHQINVHTFYNNNSVSPNLSYQNHRFGDVPFNIHRLAFAAAQFSGSAVCLHKLPHPNADGSIAVWDELVKGREKSLGWLGKPLDKAVHIALEETDQLRNKGELLNNVLEKFELINTNAVFENGKIRLSGKSNEKEVRLTIKKTVFPKNEFTLYLKASCDPMKDYLPEMARHVIVRPVINGQSAVSDDREWWWNFADRRYGYVNDKSFENYFYFNGLPEDSIEIEISFESNEPVYIEDIRLLNAPDAMYRAFENGIVIANPSAHDFTFNLQKINPGTHYRRIQATEFQDAKTNNGQVEEEVIILPKYDALFLIKK